MEKKQMAAGEFKAKCLELMDLVAKEGSEILITKHGKPVARLVPAQKSDDQTKGSIFGALQGTVEELNKDAFAPEPDLWKNVEKEPDTMRLKTTKKKMRAIKKRA